MKILKSRGIRKAYISKTMAMAMAMTVTVTRAKIENKVFEHNHVLGEQAKGGYKATPIAHVGRITSCSMQPNALAAECG